MDPVTAATVAALASGVTSGLAQQAVSDAYTALKARLSGICGGNSSALEAVGRLENRPDSAARAGVVAEELAAAGAGEDAELVELAEALLSRIEAQPGGERHIQQATGSGIAQSDLGGSATVTIHHHKE